MGPESVVPGERKIIVEGEGVFARGGEEAMVAEEEGAAGSGGLGLGVPGGEGRAGVAEVGEEGGVEEVAVAEELGGGRLLLRDGEHRGKQRRHNRRPSMEIGRAHV